MLDSNENDNEQQGSSDSYDSNHDNNFNDSRLGAEMTLALSRAQTAADENQTAINLPAAVDTETRATATVNDNFRDRTRIKDKARGRLEANKAREALGVPRQDWEELRESLSRLDCEPRKVLLRKRDGKEYEASGRLFLLLICKRTGIFQT